LRAWGGPGETTDPAARAGVVVARVCGGRGEVRLLGEWRCEREVVWKMKEHPVFAKHWAFQTQADFLPPCQGGPILFQLSGGVRSQSLARPPATFFQPSGLRSFSAQAKTAASLIKCASA